MRPRAVSALRGVGAPFAAEVIPVEDHMHAHPEGLRGHETRRSQRHVCGRSVTPDYAVACGRG